MKTFEHYFNSFRLDCDPENLDFCLKDQEFSIFAGPEILKTPGGKDFSHSSEELIRLLITDIQLYRSCLELDFTSHLLFSYLKDILESGYDPFFVEWENQLADDPFVRIKTANKGNFQPFSPDDPLFNFAFVSLTGLMTVVNHFAARIMGEVVMEESEIQPFQEILRLSYQRLANYQKVVVQALGSLHHSGTVLPILLVSGEINALEYAKGLISLKIHTQETLTDILAGVAKVQSFLGVLIEKPHQERQAAAMIVEGEGAFIEFKSTLRWDIRAGKTNPAIERSCLKTISAFLNSTGGNLLIGVRDDGAIEGIETDKFANEDKFLLHLWTLIRLCLGRDFSPYISTRLEKADGKTICIVDCRPSNRPVFLRQPGFDEEMYIRLGPSSNALNISEAMAYIGNHFNS
jgi:hypothetical protein